MFLIMLIVPISLFNQIYPSLEKFYNFKLREIASEISECYSTLEETDELDPHLLSTCSHEDKGHRYRDVTKYVLSSNAKLKILTSPDFKQRTDEIKKLCKGSFLHDKENLTQFVMILVFMAAILDRNRNELSFCNEVDEQTWNYNNYIHNIREDLLRLYKARHDSCKEYHKSCYVRFGNSATEIEIQTKFPWFEKMLDIYLDNKLGVQGSDEADKELQKNYSKNVGAKLDKTKAGFIWGTYNLLQISQSFHRAESVTNKQCRFIHSYLSILGLSDKYEVESVAANRIRGNLNSYIKHFGSIVYLGDDIEYKLPPDNTGKTYY